VIKECDKNMILVTGGAGYIGSHATKELLNKGYKVIVIDNLSTGNIEAIDKRAIFIEGDLGNSELLEKIFKSYNIEGVMHFAANCLVEESVNKPLKYYQNNVGKSLNLILAMLENNIKNFIFSSTCATYGTPSIYPISEQTPQLPINPYGKSKLMLEQILRDISDAHELNYVIFRYFNVAGADSSGLIGEDHEPETHLIPNILKHLQGKIDSIKVFGNQYATSDGTCIRDYIHVTDLCNAHILGLEYLLNHQDKKIMEVFNLGSEKGYSVLEIIQECEKITGVKANIKYFPGRKGDPSKLVASSQKIKRILGWLPQNKLKQIIETAWKWHKNHPDGY
jgi:UDP-glucose 4-epimerase